MNGNGNQATAAGVTSPSAANNGDVKAGSSFGEIVRGVFQVTDEDRAARIERLERETAELMRAEAEDRRIRKLEALRARSGVPMRFAGNAERGIAAVSFDAFQERNESLRRAKAQIVDFVENFDEMAKIGRSLILAGPAGTGKTMLACAAILALCGRGKRAQYVKIGDMIRRIRASWRSEGGETELEILRELRSADLLVVDEIGVQYGTEGEAVHTFDVFDGRYQDMRPTIVITNCTPEELQRFLDARVIDRLRENGGRMVKFDGTSARGGV